jgi:predicted MPP superfamily phosphohydrolase
LNGTVAVALSDLHLGSHIGGRWLRARVGQVLAERPDVVFLLGDVFDGHGLSVEEIVPEMQRLTAPLGVWVVNGNHDRYGRNNAGEFIFDSAGIRVLHDSSAVLAPGLIVAGVDNLSGRGRSGRGEETVSKALANRPEGATVFLSHLPLYADAAAEMGVGLMLSGHTHGGQIWPFGYLVEREYPLLAGQYDVGGMTVIVSRGAGTWGPRMRLWQPGEILHLTLYAE